MTRIALAAVLALSAAAFGVHPARAQVGEAPWCAVVSLGPGAAYWDCRYNSIEECVPNVIAGNRGFCNHNPRYTPKTEAPQKHHKRRARRS